MPQNYHIYIHGDGAYSPSQATVPFDQRSGGYGSEGINATSPLETQESEIDSAINDSGVMKSLSSLGVAALSKVFPWVAIAIAIMKIADNAITNSINAYSKFTGSYKYSVGANNFHTMISNLTNPIGVWRQMYNQRIDAELMQQRIEKTRSTLGATNFDIYKRGV